MLIKKLVFKYLYKSKKKINLQYTILFLCKIYVIIYFYCVMSIEQAADVNMYHTVSTNRLLSYKVTIHQIVDQIVIKYMSSDVHHIPVEKNPILVC